MMYSNHVEIKMMFNVNFRILFPELLLVMWHDAELPMSCIYIYILHTYIFWQVQSWSCPPNVHYIFWSLLDYTYEININSIRNNSILLKLNHITSFIMKQLCPARTLRMWVWHSPQKPRSRNRRTCPQIFVYYGSCWIYIYIRIAYPFKYGTTILNTASN